MRFLATICLFLAVARATNVSNAQAATLAVDLSMPVIEINTGFAGADLLLFGAIDRDSDVVVVVSGPKKAHVVRRKARIAGIWVNADSRTFEQVPSYYRIASTRKLEEITSERALGRLGIGNQRLRFKYVEGQSATDREAFREALIRNKVRSRLYSAAPLPVAVTEGRLFRTTFDFPANVPTGAYGVDVYLLRAGKVLSHRTRTLNVAKVGLEAGIFNFAHKYAALYGIIAIVIALFCGWLAGVIFRRA